MNSLLQVESFKPNKILRYFPAIVLLTFLFATLATPGLASDLQFENIRYLSKADSKGELFVIFDVKWQNSWRNSRNHDAVWVFLKFPAGNGFKYAKISKVGNSIVPMPGGVSPKA